VVRKGIWHECSNAEAVELFSDAVELFSDFLAFHFFFLGLLEVVLHFVYAGYDTRP
jgi:hypothetical protein